MVWRNQSQSKLIQVLRKAGQVWKWSNKKEFPCAVSLDLHISDGWSFLGFVSSSQLTQASLSTDFSSGEFFPEAPQA